MAAEKALFVLSNEGAGAGAEHRDFLLDLLYIILTRLEINLCRSSQFR